MPESGEEVAIADELAFLRTHLEREGVPKWSGSSERAGRLSLSNHRIRFTAESDEWDNPTSPDRLLDAALGSIRRITLAPAGGSTRVTGPAEASEQILVIATRDETYEFRFEGSDPEDWQKMISRAKESFLSMTLPGSVQTASPIRVRCQFCHNVYDDSLGRCPRCGATHP